MQRLNNINDWFARVEGILLSFFLLTVVVLSFAQVVSRNLFGVGILWADAIVRMLILWIALIGAALATEKVQHLSIEIVNKLLPEKVQRAVHLTVNLFAAVVSFFLLEAGYRFVRLEKEAGGQFFGNISQWMVESIIPIAFFLIVLHFLMAILNDLTGFSKKKQ